MKHRFINERDEVYTCDTLKEKAKIINSIKFHLLFSRNGCVDHYIDENFVCRYSNNPKTGKPCREIDRGNKTYYRSI